MWNRFVFSRLLIASLGLFALMPCVLKQHLAMDLQTIYVKGNSKAVATCVFVQERQAGATKSVQMADRQRQIPATVSAQTVFETMEKASIWQTIPKSLVANSPPLYILHENMKIAC